MQNLNNVPRASYNCNRHTSTKDTQIIFRNIMRMYGQTKQHGQLFSEPLSKDRPILIPNIPYQWCWGLLAQYPYTGKMYWCFQYYNHSIDIDINITEKHQHHTWYCIDLEKTVLAHPYQSVVLRLEWAAYSNTAVNSSKIPRQSHDKDIIGMNDSIDKLKLVYIKEGNSCTF